MAFPAAVRVGGRVHAEMRVRVAVASWVVLVAASHLWGRLLAARGAELFVPVPPLFARWGPELGPLVAVPVVTGALIVAFGPRACTRLRWRHLLLAAWAAAAAWAVALAVTRGPEAIWSPLLDDADYRVNLALVEGPGHLLRTFTGRITDFSVHVQGHPPGVLLLLWALGRVGLGAVGVEAALVIGAGASAVPATMLAVREVAGEAWARRAAPFLVLAPAAVWIATSVDALYLGLGAWAAALGVLATAERPRRWIVALGSGVLFGAGLHASYGILPLGAIPLAVALRRRRFDVLAAIAIGAGAVTTTFAAAGFWWLDGLRATAERYRAGISSLRPQRYFVLANLAAFGLAVGPAAAAGLSRLRDRGVWLLVGAGLAAVAAADLSGLSKAEVERIWLPFVPWVLAATAALSAEADDRVTRAWLGTQAALALGVQIALRTPW